MFKRLLSSLTGRKPAESLPPPTQPAYLSDEPTIQSPDPTPLVSVLDAHGRVIRISPGEWRDKVLPQKLEAAWDAPDALYSLIYMALQDRLAAEALPAAQRLVEIDPLPGRAHSIHGVALAEAGRLDEAEATLRAGIAKVGEKAILLTNLARVFEARGDREQAADTLWRAVQADPNQENALHGWTAGARARGGLAAYLSAVRQAMALPGSWRPQLWLARHHLEQGDVESALMIYDGVQAAGHDSGTALMVMTGDLGQFGHAAQMLERFYVVFDPARHDPLAGYNLLCACELLGRLDEGNALLARLYALNRPELRGALDRFARAFAEQASQAAPADQADAPAVGSTAPQPD